MENIQIILGLILVVIIGVLIYKSHQKSKRIELFETIFMIAQQTLLFNSSYFLNLNSLDKLKLPHENPKFDILLSEYNKLNKDNLDITIRTALEEWLSEIFYKSNGSIFQKETIFLVTILKKIYDDQVMRDIKRCVIDKIFKDPRFDFGFLQTLKIAQASCKENYQVIAYLNESRLTLDNYLPNPDSGLNKWKETLERFELILREASNGNALDVINEWIGRNGAPPAN